MMSKHFNPMKEELVDNTPVNLLTPRTPTPDSVNNQAGLTIVGTMPELPGRKQR